MNVLPNGSGGPAGVFRRTRLRLPVRLKLAVVSAGLTFVILCLFAVVVGALAASRIRTGFDDEVRATAADLQDQVKGLEATSDSTLRLPPSQLNALRAAATGGAVVRIIGPDSRVYSIKPNAPDLGPPLGGVVGAGSYRVVSRPLAVRLIQRSNPFDPFRPGIGTSSDVGYLQYAKPLASVRLTIAKLKVFLVLGILGGTALAFLAGLAVARRAMRPIADLTRTAREVARTRDPQVTLPKPEANDEVADLANTLEDMLGELDAARAETEAALTRQREFVADASHELRTPLTSILANLELLEAELAGEEHEMASSALRSSRRMRRLVADLLLLARADAGRKAPRRPIDLAAVVREAAGEAASLASGHDLALDLPPAAEEPTVDGVPDDLHRMALNLIENALVHTPAGTPVTASIRSDGDQVVLEVADRGPGVPAPMRDRVFDRFSRAAADSGAPGGSGLGLAIVRAVAEGHGGSVELDDAPGGGALFRVRLPAAGAVDSAPSEAPPARGAVRPS